MSLKTLQDALHTELSDLLNAESQLIQTLPKLAEAAHDADLKAAFEEHLHQTEEHVHRLYQAFAILGQEPEKKTCEAMKGLIKEGDHVLKEDADPQVLDAMLIAAAQKVEHYEIASYGTVCTWAEELGLTDLKDLLGQTLGEEEATDEKLSTLAERSINEQAVA